ncbi:PilZ domain-containing protein [Halobacillus yeomjeoni]|uniref:PilZ domain-containing protein n=1 Tax=Halobacillus yeomjeoni TaxID=311194 RepID=UPI001CD1D7E2|nr:PilZ domain-containing protein [Halobacillus yeomjeoni]MCA0984100.1 PilZ domain-containing protein [Halobacillus yeomjeoni]
MRYRRKETLRYTFGDPRPANFKITKIDSRTVSTSMGKAEVLDISPGGMKLSTEVNVPLTMKVQLLVQTTIADIPLTFTADVMWSKEVDGFYHYGLQFIEDQGETVIQALKKYRKQESE